MVGNIPRGDNLIDRLERSNISLQNKTIDLIKSISELTKRLDRLVAVFEKAASTVGETKLNEEQVRELSYKLESLLEQNKNLARGLLLMERYVRSRTPLNLPPKPLIDYGKL